MSTQVNNPFDVFFDSDGTPLENGYIYLGTYGLNPEVNPVAVFWDKARNIPASQPIRTLGGSPVRNGTPSNIYIAETLYSITVKDKNKEFVYSELFEKNDHTQTVDNMAQLKALPNPTDGMVVTITGYYTQADGGEGDFVFDASSTALANDGTIVITDAGGVGRWLRLFNGYPTVEMFGAVGGMADATVRIQAAIDALPADGDTLIFGVGVFNVTAKLTTNERGVILQGSGEFATVINSLTTDLVVLEASGSFTKISNLQIQVLGTTGIGIRLTGVAQGYISEVQLLSKNAGSNVAIQLRDNSVAGAYSHVIHKVNASAGNFEFAKFVECVQDLGGQNAVRINDCHAVADIIFETVASGGGNIVTDNLFQSRTGTYGSPAGTAIISKGPGDIISNNYFERFNSCVEGHSATLPPLLSVNHNDNCTTMISLVTSAMYPMFSVDNSSGVQAFTQEVSNYNLSANNEKIETNALYVNISGNGAFRTDAYLSKDNAMAGQLLYVGGESWAFQLVENGTADFGSCKSTGGMVFGQEGGAASVGAYNTPSYRAALFRYNGTVWVLQDATRYKAALGSPQSQTLTGNGQAVLTDSPFLYLLGDVAPYTGAILNPPTVGGQKLTIMNTSANTITLAATNVTFGAAGLPVIGAGVGNVLTIEFVAFLGVWYETSRVVN